MKRSEMIRLIDQCLYDYTDDDFMVLKPSEFVYELLKRIEEAGMLPPTVVWEPYIEDGAGTRHPLGTSKLNCWEPEHDPKKA